jgi:N6-adenosine-specific RNA methylase IME4
MIDLTINNGDIVSQLLVAHRLLSDVAARLVTEADKSGRTGSRRNDPTPRSFGYTNSLGRLIQEGHQFGTIYAEPPWPIDGKQHGRAKFDRRFTADELATLPIAKLAAPASHLHIWAPDRFLREAMHVIESWGFIYKASLVMIAPEHGDGRYWGIGHQYLLLGVRGDAPFLGNSPRSWFFEPDRSIQSDWRPYHAKTLVELVSPYPRLHLFDESVGDGWISWGQSIPSYFDPDKEDEWAPGPDIDWQHVETETSDPPDEADTPLVFDASTDKPMPLIRDDKTTEHKWD